MTIGDCSQGDTFEVDGTTYMAMIRVRNGWGCRPLVDGQWEEHKFFDDTLEVGDITRKKKVLKDRTLSGEETHQLGESRREWWSV